jgi:ArsR family transcriptional regulator
MDCCKQDGPCKSEDEISACVGEIGRDLGIVPSTVSHHIKELFNAGLIRMERRGQNVQCWIEDDTLGDMSKLFEQWTAATNA